MSRRPIIPAEGTFDIATANTLAGAVKTTARFDLVGASIHIHVTSGSYRIEASNDGANWLTVGATPITASEIRTLAAQYAYMRIFTVTHGGATAVLHAHEHLW